MRKRIIFIGIIVLFSLFLSGCSKNREAEVEVIARLGGYLVDAKIYTKIPDGSWKYQGIAYGGRLTLKLEPNTYEIKGKYYIPRSQGPGTNIYDEYSVTTSSTITSGSKTVVSLYLKWTGEVAM